RITVAAHHYRDAAVALQHLRETDVSAVNEVGIDELVIVDSPPADVAAIPDWAAGLAGQFARAGRTPNVEQSPRP
ncbi:MAG: hypothetical protein ACRDTV_16395, partial [Mycobacterium sp.]